MNFVREDEVESEKKQNDKSDEEDEDEIERTNEHKNTFVGTAEYVSPEVLIDQPAGPATDLWALGCIIFQMFAGFSPFKDKTEYLVFRKILELKFTFPDTFPKEAKDLINSLLVINPTKRLGSGVMHDNNVSALKSHPFFEGIDFSSIYKTAPPFISEFKAKQKSSPMIKSHSSGLEMQRHKNTIQVIKQEIIEKKSPWFHYNTRKVVLDNTPKIEYIDPEKNVVKVNYLFTFILNSIGSYLFE
jgi:serine/threonine protein kinase